MGRWLRKDRQYATTRRACRGFPANRMPTIHNAMNAFERLWSSFSEEVREGKDGQDSDDLADPVNRGKEARLFQGKSDLGPRVVHHDVVIPYRQ